MRSIEPVSSDTPLEMRAVTALASSGTGASAFAGRVPLAVSAGGAPARRGQKKRTRPDDLVLL
jgi:hypothetical protein